jgi:hypothetical protein
VLSGLSSGGDSSKPTATALVWSTFACSVGSYLRNRFSFNNEFNLLSSSASALFNFCVPDLFGNLRVSEKDLGGSKLINFSNSP